MGRRVDREGPVHQAIVDWLRVVMPDAMVYHCKNEINKKGKAKGWVQNNIALEIGKAKKKGTIPGFPDLLVLPFANIGAFFLEVKAKGNYASPAQKEVHAELARLGYHVAVVRSIDDVRKCLQEWGVGFREKIKE